MARSLLDLPWYQSFSYLNIFSHLLNYYFLFKCVTISILTNEKRTKILNRGINFHIKCIDVYIFNKAFNATTVLIVSVPGINWSFGMHITMAVNKVYVSTIYFHTHTHSMTFSIYSPSVKGFVLSGLALLSID